MSQDSSSDFATVDGVAGVDRRHRPSDFFHERTNFRFMDKRRVFLALFLVVVIGGPLLLLLRPLNLGIDFRGGVAWQVVAPKGRAVDVAKVRDVLDKTSLKDYKATVSRSPKTGQQTIRVQAQVVSDAIETIRVEASLCHAATSISTMAPIVRISSGSVKTRLAPISVPLRRPVRRA